MYNVYDVDLFRKLETEIGLYSQKGDVYLIGDLNSRTGGKKDFIVDDSELLDFEDTFSIDTPMRRCSLDRGSNRFGDCLLDLCKSLNIKILNGRLFLNTDKMTCFTANGESVVDYVVTSQNKFTSISDMQVHDFNEFSIHAPIIFSLKIGTERSNITDATYRTVHRWDENLKKEFVENLMHDSHILNDALEDILDVDESVNFFQ